MGLLTGLLGAAAPLIGNYLLPGVGGAIGSALGGAIAGSGGAKQSSTQSAPTTTSTTQTNVMDPRVGNMLFGQGTDGGLLGGYQNLLKKPEDPSLGQYGRDSSNYLANLPVDQNLTRFAAGNMMMPQQAGQVQATGQAPLAYMSGNMVKAPGQNNIDLTGAYNDKIYGDAGANPYLTRAIQGGIDQSSQAMGRMQDDSTRNLMENILPSLRSNSVIAGQYGGSRQGIAEGRAIGDFGREQQRTMENFGNNNTSAAVGAQANSFNQGQDRSLAAMQTLGGQQYATAFKNADTLNAAEQMNVNRTNDVNANYAARNDAAQLTNQNLRLQQQQQNNAGAIAGAGLLGGQMQSALGGATNQNNYGLNQAQGVNGLLAPYLGQVPGSASSTSSGTQPIYQNQGAGLLGGAMAGLGLYNQFNQTAGSNGALPGQLPNVSVPNGIDWGKMAQVDQFGQPVQ